VVVVSCRQPAQDTSRRNLLGPSLTKARRRRAKVEEREGKLFVRADPPGLTKDDVKVEVTDDYLTIEGERKQEKEEKREGYHRSERSYGSFNTSIALPEGAFEVGRQSHDPRAFVAKNGVKIFSRRSEGMPCPRR
jgi:HSP20 family molecular chaperone IbpA